MAHVSTPHVARLRAIGSLWSPVTEHVPFKALSARQTRSRATAGLRTSFGLTNARVGALGPFSGTLQMGGGADPIKTENADPIDVRRDRATQVRRVCASDRPNVADSAKRSRTHASDLSRAKRHERASACRYEAEEKSLRSIKPTRSMIRRQNASIPSPSALRASSGNSHARNRIVDSSDARKPGVPLAEILHAVENCREFLKFG